MSQQPGPCHPLNHRVTAPPTRVLGCEREVLLTFATEISGRDEHAYTLPCPVPTVMYYKYVQQDRKVNREENWSEGKLWAGNVIKGAVTHDPVKRRRNRNMGAGGGGGGAGVGARRVLCSPAAGDGRVARSGGPRISSSAPGDSGAEPGLGGRPQSHLVCGVGVLLISLPWTLGNTGSRKAEVGLGVTVTPGGIQGAFIRTLLKRGGKRLQGLGARSS